MSRHHPAAVIIAALSTLVLVVVAAGLTGCGGSSHGTASPIFPDLRPPPINVSPHPSGSPSVARSGTPTPHGSGGSGGLGGASGGATSQPTEATPVPGISAKPHAVKLPPWPGNHSQFHGPVNSQVSTGTSAVALTFDDGPGPYTSDILDLLDQNHIKATFCLIGRQIKDYRRLVARMINDGMTICNHSWDHDEQLGHKSVAQIAANLRKTDDAVHAINPKATVAYFRHPGGSFTQTAVSVCEQLGMRPLYWGVDTDDWTMPGTEKIEKSLSTDVHAGSIVLMHDAGGDRTQTLDALREMLPTLAKTYRLAALSTARTSSVIPPPLPAPHPSPPPTPPSTPPSASVLSRP
jgi:peptidoglycan/xylan/chitin deacetylase (PgdA/CDA1 family)